MSFLDDIIGIGKAAVDFLGSKSIGSQIAKTALTGLALNQLTKSVNKKSDPPRDTKGTQVTVNPNVENSIPVIYGRTTVGGLVVDANISADNQTMYYAYVISEKTGNLLSNGQASVFTFEEVFWNNNKIIFDTDGVTAKSLLAEDGFEDTSIAGNVKIYCYGNGSTNQVFPNGYPAVGNTPAYSIMPDWTSNHSMSGLVFAIIQVKYNPEKNITGIGDVQFRVNNTLTQPGDVLYDYMTNTRYGAGINASEINA